MMATEKQISYLTALIAEGDIRFDYAVKLDVGRAVKSLILTRAAELLAAGLTIERASVLIDGLKSGRGGWQAAAKACGLTNAEIQGVSRAAIAARVK